MSDLWLKIKIWTKVAVAAIVLIYVVLFAVFNSEKQAELWFFFGSGKTVQTTVLKLVLLAFVSGALLVVLLRTTFRTLGQIRELKARQAVEKRDREIEELKTKAGMLRSRPKAESSPSDTSVPLV